MKKTISINIAGLIFYIEEDGYDRLRQYLASVHRYFSAFADSTEIVADIESRIAERFLMKQKTENKQAISVEDVDELIKAMGNVSDFEAAEEAEDLISEPKYSSQGEVPPVSESQAGRQGGLKEPRGKFYRDLKRKILGGVAGGIAHYYAMDPLWVRLLLLLGIFGTVPISGILNMRLEQNFAMLSGILLIGYIAMWVAFPGSTVLEDNLKVKKYYRNPEHKVLGGVASGLSSYFNVDTGVIRFIWVISIFFFGTGLLAYIILWAIAPAANTLTEKMEMQGEPITLFNIDSNIKRNLEGAVTERGRDSDLRKLLLLPFTIIGKILNALGKALRELGPVIRVLAGIIMVGIAGVSLFSLLIFGAALLGLASLPDFGSLPSEFLVLKDMPTVLILSVVALMIIPVLVILFLGLMLLLKRKVVGPTVWIVMAGLFIFSIIGAVSSGIVYQRNFSESGEYIHQSSLPLGASTLTIDGDDYHTSRRVHASVFLKGTFRKDSIRIEERYSSEGATRSVARQLASQVEYNIEMNDSTLFLPDGPLSAETLPYRNQHIDVTIEVPYHYSFAMTREFFFGRLHRDSRSDENMAGMNIRHHDLNWGQLRWAFLPDSGLVCLNFPEKFKQEVDTSGDATEEWGHDENFEGVSLGERGEFVKQFAVGEFKGVDLGGAYHVMLRRGDKYTVKIDGSEANVEALDVKVENGLLLIEQLEKNTDLPEPGKRIGVVITMPILESIQLSGANVLKVEGFEQFQTLNVKLTGATRTELEANADKLDIELSGVSQMRLKGSINNFSARLSGTCLLQARDSHIKNAEVNASGVSKAYLGAVENLDKKETGQSGIFRN